MSGDDLFADVVDEGVAIGMLLVDVMAFAPFFLPLLFVGWEESVGLGRGVVDLRQTEPVCERQGLTVDTGTADDVDILVGGAVGEGLFERRVDVTAWEGGLTAGEDDVTTVGEGALRQGEVGVTPHDDGMTRGECLETLQIVRQPIDQFVLISDGPVLRHRCYNANHNSQFSIIHSLLP